MVGKNYKRKRQRGPYAPGGKPKNNYKLPGKRVKNGMEGPEGQSRDEQPQVGLKKEPRQDLEVYSAETPGAAESLPCGARCFA
jgi:hypothetical protein